MKVNSTKMAVDCISDALNYRATTYFYNRDEQKIESGTKMKMLGTVG